jgi:hypothetical protein
MDVLERLAGFLAAHDGNTITGHRLLSREGVNWEGDLDLTDTKVG